jgi:glycosyltransferase involved in cell wall biosynthesis
VTEDRPQICLIERYADRLAGHWGDNLVRLCVGAQELDLAATVVAVAGMHDNVRPLIESSGAAVVDAPGERDVVSRACLAGDKLMRRGYSALSRWLPRSGIADQWLYLARCLGEISSLRTAHRAGSTPGRPKVVVVLSASETLNAFAAALSRVPHVRVVHDHSGSEGPVLRLLERLSSRSLRHVTVAATTPSVEAALLTRYPDLHTTVQSYAVVDPATRISADERAPARRALGIAGEELVGSLVGGWWPYKDIDVVSRAFEKVTHPLSLIVAGRPVDAKRLDALDRSVQAAGGRLIDRVGARTEPELRELYAACDFTIVSRVPGNEMESGLVFDAVRYGVPLVVSDHDVRMSSSLKPEPWVLLFPPGDSGALATVFDEIATKRLPRPGRAVPRRMGMRTAVDTVRRFVELQPGSFTS